VTMAAEDRSCAISVSPHAPYLSRRTSERISLSSVRRLVRAFYFFQFVAQLQLGRTCCSGSRYSSCASENLTAASSLNEVCLLEETGRRIKKMPRLMAVSRYMTLALGGRPHPIISGKRARAFPLSVCTRQRRRAVSPLDARLGHHPTLSRPSICPGTDE
jgi:hypothetical protein